MHFSRSLCAFMCTLLKLSYALTRPDGFVITLQAVLIFWIHMPANFKLDLRQGIGSRGGRRGREGHRAQRQPTLLDQGVEKYFFVMPYTPLRTQALRACLVGLLDAGVVHALVPGLEPGALAADKGLASAAAESSSGKSLVVRLGHLLV